MDSKLTVSFGGPCSYYVLADSLQVNELFKKLFFLDNDVKLIRLYKKYVKCDDLLSTASLVERYKGEFSGNDSKLYARLMEAFKKASKYAETQCKKFGSYQPFRLELLNLPFFRLDLNIPLEDYDNNEGEPFWMRPEYILEHYSQK